MPRPNYQKQISQIIHESAPGSIFIPSDFADIAEPNKVSMCLTRLKNAGELETIKRGVYMKPRYSPLLQMNVPARMDDVAKAIARNFGWTIAPCGDTAINLLGLSTQVPAIWSYVSDGPYKEYTIGETKLQFKHTDKNSEISGLTHETALVIQTLKAMGKDAVTEDTINRIAKKFGHEEKQIILKESHYATGWVYEAIKQICREVSL